MGGLFLRNLIPIFSHVRLRLRGGLPWGRYWQSPWYISSNHVDWEKAETSSLALGVQMTDDQNTSARLRRKDISGSSLMRG